MFRFYEASVEGRSLRSSAGVVEEEDDEEEEEENKNNSVEVVAVPNVEPIKTEDKTEVQEDKTETKESSETSKCCACSHDDKKAADEKEKVNEKKTEEKMEPVVINESPKHEEKHLKSNPMKTMIESKNIRREDHISSRFY